MAFLNRLAQVGAAATGILFVGLACRSGGVSLPDPIFAVVPQEARLFYDDTPAFQDSVRIVIRNAVEFGSVWEEATGGDIAMPTVDFERALVLVVSSGRMTPEDQIRVDSVGIQNERTPDGDVREVLTAIVVTTVGCGRFRSAAYPREIVTIRPFDGPVRFEERRVNKTNCEEAPGK